MKACPNCKAALDENARFCLCCMTSLIEKEQILPPARRVRRWPLVLLCVVCLAALAVCGVVAWTYPPDNTGSQSAQNLVGKPAEPSLPEKTEGAETLTCAVDGVCYTFRRATREDQPTAVMLDQYYVLIRVEGVPADGVYRVPSFVDNDTAALVTVIADGAFSGTDAQVIDLGYNVRYVWGNAFGGYALTDLYLHGDVFIDRAAFSGCGGNLTIHCPPYLENTKGVLWTDLAEDYGFCWQDERI